MSFGPTRATTTTRADLFRIFQNYSFQGRYDDLKTAQENIDLQTTILSRFDLIFIVRDERLYERDLAIADHVLGIHAGHGGEIATDGSIVPVGQDKNPEAERQVKFLKRYVEYCRATCSPRLVPTSAKLLEDSYVRYRQEMRERAKKGGAPAVPVAAVPCETSSGTAGPASPGPPLRFSPTFGAPTCACACAAVVAAIALFAASLARVAARIAVSAGSSHA